MYHWTGKAIQNPSGAKPYELSVEFSGSPSDKHVRFTTQWPTGDLSIEFVNIGGVARIIRGLAKIVEDGQGCVVISCKSMQFAPPVAMSLISHLASCLAAMAEMGNLS